MTVDDMLDDIILQEKVLERFKNAKAIKIEEKEDGSIEFTAVNDEPSVKAKGPPHSDGVHP